MSNKMRKCVLVYAVIVSVTLQLLFPRPIKAKTALQPKINQTNVALLEKKSLKLSILNKKKNATTTWKVQNRKLASVTQKGKVKGIKKGSTNVFCKYKSNGSTRIFTCKLKIVKGAKAISIVNAKGNATSDYTLHKNEKVRLKVKITPSQSNDVVSWKSDNPKVASVSKNGLVKSKKEGKAYIKATTLSRKKAGVWIWVKDKDDKGVNATKKPTGEPLSTVSPSSSPTPSSIPSPTPTPSSADVDIDVGETKKDDNQRDDGWTKFY